MELPIQTISYPDADKHKVKISILRLDLIHPLVNGNKWFKLKYNLQAAINNSSDGIIQLDLSQPVNISPSQIKILTFGGAYSNHIYATAAAGNLFNIPTIGMIRGEENSPLNPTLEFAQAQGMELFYLSREAYKQRNSITLHQELKAKFGNIYIIPEGGCNQNGVRGCTEILNLVHDYQAFDVICVACGTGTTLAGIILSLYQNQRVIGFPVLKGGEFLKPEITKLINQYLATNLPLPGDRSVNWDLVCDYHFGGYARINKNLLTFKQEFERLTVIESGIKSGMELDYIYTSKMFYGVVDLIKQGYFPNCRLLLVHTGGLQGNKGMKQKLSKIL